MNILYTRIVTGLMKNPNNWICINKAQVFPKNADLYVRSHIQEATMEIILQGRLNSEDTAKSLISVLRLFNERYHISSFREVHLHVTLVDEQGDDVDLVNNDTNEVYRIFEVRQQQEEPLTSKHQRESSIHLVIDNTKPKSHQ